MKNAEEMVLEKNRAMITIDASDPIKRALSLMIKHKIGAVLVTEYCGNLDRTGSFKQHFKSAV